VAYLSSVSFQCFVLNLYNSSCFPILLDLKTTKLHVSTRNNQAIIILTQFFFFRSVPSLIQTRLPELTTGLKKYILVCPCHGVVCRDQITTKQLITTNHLLGCGIPFQRVFSTFRFKPLHSFVFSHSSRVDNQ
jgi:hypothetical protein